MKKNHKYEAWYHHALEKTFLVMRMVIVISLVCIMQSFALESFTQNSKISLSVREMKLEDIMIRIEAQTKYRFAYNKTEIDVDKSYSVNINDAEVTELLRQLFSKGDVNYTIIDRQIVLSSSKETSILQQRRSIYGKVSDSSGSMLPGVSVVIKGTTLGTITDADGNYSLSNIPENAILQFSFVGMKMQEMPVGGKSKVDVTMIEENVGLEEVVAIGYATQKKVNLTGSVASVTIEDLEKRPVTNTVSALQGKVTGLRVTQNTGMPGREGVSLQLRGASSWGTSTTPLVLIDGVVGSLDNIPSTDIENISVLKDAASASIYGSRAANGVILVTTKQGRSGKPVFSYSTIIGSQSATITPAQIWNSVQYMTLFNKAVARGALTANPFPQSIIDLYSGSNRDMNAYPDYNWSKAVWRNALMQQHNVGVNGGTDVFKYNISAGFLDQDGVLKWHDYKRYNGLANLSAKINKFVSVGTNINYLYGKSTSPYEQNSDFILLYMTQSPMTQPYLPDGSGKYTCRAIPTGIGGTANNLNPFLIGNETYRKYEDWKANIQGWIDVDFLHRKDMTLKWSTKYATSFALQFQNLYRYSADCYYYLKESDYSAGGSDEYVKSGNFGSVGLENYNYRTTLNTLYSTLSWGWQLQNHDISAMVGYSQESQKYRSLGGQRTVFPVKTMYEIGGLGSTGQSIYGSLTEWAFQSMFGRVAYAYKSKYLFEGNIRYDGTSKITKVNRWGFFPSGALAWRISEEGFLKDNFGWINNLKLRLSYGLLGNADIGNYPYQETYSTTSYGFSEALEQGVVQSSFKNKELKWEKTKITNIGLDFNIRKDIFYGTIDLYNKYTTGILASASIPASAGMSAPTINYGEFKNYGIELSIGHTNKIGELTYDINAQVSINRNKVMKYPAPSYGTRIIEEGNPYNDYYLYECTGIFKSQEEIDAIETPGNPQLGDLKFKDQNDDKKITGDDRVRMKGAYPDFIYSFGANCSWRNFDLSMFFQGVKGLKYRITRNPFTQGSSPEPKWLNAYDPDTNPDSDVPAIYGGGYTPMDGTTASGSSYYLKNASYLRLKNIQLGYNLSSELLKKIGISQLRIYVGGDNLFTFTKFSDGDPERSGDGDANQYPQLKTLLTGLNLKF